MKILLLSTLVFLVGCCFSRQVMFSAEGKNVRTPYGRGDGNFSLMTNTQWGQQCK